MIFFGPKDVEFLPWTGGWLVVGQDIFRVYRFILMVTADDLEYKIMGVGK
jgi:hypothetical protein